MKNLLGTVPVFSARGTKEASRHWVEREAGLSVVTTMASATHGKFKSWDSLSEGFHIGRDARASVTPSSRMCAASGKGGHLGQSNVALFLQEQFPKRDAS